MKKEYNMPQVEVVIPTMSLMQQTNPASKVGNPSDSTVDPNNPMAPARKLYL